MSLAAEFSGAGELALAGRAIGTGLLLVGWLGFNAGSAGAADALVATAAFNTILAAGAAALLTTGVVVEGVPHLPPRSWLIVGWLAVVEGPGRGEVLALGYGVNDIGRGADARMAVGGNGHADA